MVMQEDHTDPDVQLTVAVLGPLGTYTHEAAHKCFGTTVKYVEQETIKNVFDALSSTADLGVVPQENSIFGSVIESYDTLRQPNAGFVRGEITLQIQHCLLVRQGVELHEIREIMSHEQALGQCRNFIAANLPSASLVRTSSTAAAAQTLLSKPLGCAAICSSVCASLFDGLSVLRQGIQDADGNAANFTRFYIVTKEDVTIPTTHLPVQLGRALIQTSIPKSPTIRTANITQLLTALKMNITRIDRRPSVEDLPFHDVYFLELAQDSATRFDDIRWASEVESAVERVRQSGGEARSLGIW